jgi:hypothetical protein
MKNIDPAEMLAACEILANGRLLVADDLLTDETKAAIETVVDGLGCRELLEDKPITSTMYRSLMRAAYDWLHARRWLAEFPSNLDAEENDE